MGRYLGIDNGEKRVGLALSDPLKIIATPFRTLLVHNTNQVIRELDKIIDEQDVELIVVGNPLGMKGQQTAQTKRTMEFTDKLRDIGYKVMLEDERLSSVSAKRAMIEQEIKTGYNKELIDQTAAAIILQQFLDKQSRM
ncbi:MAG TPA: Holliday junction resolvase RuvX [Candidatus Marinimicrobia bacterium]|nr:Holliday junction resolvase RuvX [Candidatus Neomarinimicrobiota bacterium]MDP6261967.1 Holliday junction resolvase RuvX [Candidatus Neomarinimicrobiota bacterium]MDP7127799.1 Holliday junction resolvase RuvX [Candidatus Neomarinimicrobiota bacterium]MDP7336470.1 Holliday junction resolvase RuvX [Candidatus Neomarinimicrobiota bacterium]MDP7474606.1 Holliday junction resolvase RuvX [Candidatus Neomarinimicrobiota bacterium]